MGWTPDLSGSQAAKDYHTAQVAKQAAQKKQAAYVQKAQDNKEQAIVNQNPPLDIQLDKIVAQKGKGLPTSGIDPHTPWGKRTGKYNHIRDKILAGEKLTEGEKSIATHYLGITGGAGTVPTPYSGVMDRFMKTSPAHAKAYTDKFGAMGGLNYLMATAPEKIVGNTLVGNIIKGWQGAKEKTADMAKFLNIFGKGNDAKIMEINEEAQTPINEVVQEALEIAEGPHRTEEGTITETAGDDFANWFFERDGTDNIIDTESIAYNPGKNLQVQDQYPQLQEELDQLPAPYGDGLFHRDAQGNLVDPLRNWAAQYRDQKLYNMRWDEALGRPRNWIEESAGAPYETGADIEWLTPLQKEWQHQQEEINELKKSIINNPVLETGTSPTFDLDTFLNTYSSNPYKDYSGIIRKNLPFQEPWTNVDSSEFLEGGKYHVDSIFDSEAYDNLSEDQKKILDTIDWGASLLENYAHGGYANMSTYEKMKMIADGVAESK